MYTCKVVTDSNECVEFHEYKTFFWAFTTKPPKYETWWGWDLNLGTPHYTISMRQNKGEDPEYILWKSYNNTSLNTAQIVFRTNEIPAKYLFCMLVSNLFTTHWTRWRFRIPLIDAFKMKRM